MNSKHKFERPYTCKVCSATFVYPEHVRKHEQTHNEDKKHNCIECDNSFKSISSLDNHTACHIPSSNYHLKSNNHPRGVFSNQNKDVLIPVDDKCETLTLSFMESVEAAPSEAENVYEDVVFYLPDQNVETDGLCFTNDGQAVFVSTTVAEEVHEHD